LHAVLTRIRYSPLRVNCLVRIVLHLSVSSAVNDLVSRLLAICRLGGTVASGVVFVVVVGGGDCNRSQVRTSKYTCLIFGLSIGLDPG